MPDHKPYKATIALGSNLGDASENLRLAARQVAALTIGEVRGSSIWESEP